MKVFSQNELPEIDTSASFCLGLVLAFYSCREIVPPETLEDPETSKENGVDVNLGRYDDEP